jgi:hypothetical protein
MKTIDEIMISMENQIENIKQYDIEDMDKASWGYEQGVLITGDEAENTVLIQHGTNQSIIQ